MPHPEFDPSYTALFEGLNNPHVLPCNIECEQNILGGIMLDPRAMPKVYDKLKPEHFYPIYHQELYAIFCKEFEAKRPIDILSISNRLTDLGKIEDYGGMLGLLNLAERVVSAANIELHADLIIDKWKRRELIKVGRDLIQLGAEKLPQDWDSIALAAKLKVLPLVEKDDKVQFFYRSGFQDAIYNYFQSLNVESSFLSTGLANVDDVIYGLERGEFHIFAARPGMGKSWFLNWLALSVAKQGLPVIYFTSEMSILSVTKRFISTLSGISLSKILNRSQMTEQELEAELDACEKYTNLPIFFDETPGTQLSYNYMKDYCIDIACKYGRLGLIVQDYIQLIGDSRSTNYTNELAQTSKEFKSLAVEFDCPVVCAAQLNRAVESRNDKRPGLADLRSCGQLEQDARVVGFLYRDAYYNEYSGKQNEVELIIAKNRNGATGTVNCGLIIDRGEFRSF